MATPTQGDPRLAQRHEAAVRLAREFMRRTRLSQTALAERLGANPSSLSRFLNGDEQARPTADRPGKLALLEQIEEVCSSFSLIRETPLRLPDDLTDDDANLALALRESIRHWFDRFQAHDAIQGLTLAGQIVAQVVHAPRPHRAGLASNTLLSLALLAGREEADAASPALMRRTADRMMRLFAAGMASVADASAADTRRHGPHCLEGYAGYGLCWCALRIADPALLAEGLERLFRAVPMCSEISYGHWQNLFLVIDAMLRRGVGQGRAAAVRCAGLVETAGTDAVRHILAIRDYPALLEAWTTDAVGLVDTIRAAKEDSDG